MTKRICIDATPLLYTANGIGRTTRMLIETLLRMGCEHEIMLFGRRFQGKALRQVMPGVPTRQIRLPRCCEWAMATTGMVETLCRADLYHATDFYMPLRVPERAIATIHDLIFLIHPESMADHARLTLKVGAFARRCRRVITISEYSKADIVHCLGLPPELVDVVYLGVDRELFRPEEDREALARRLVGRLGFNAPYFLAASCSSGRKNTPRLISAYAKLVERRPNNHLVVVWNPPEEIRERFQQLELDRYIHFVGRQSDDELRDLYCGATAFAYPSSYEGFGLPVVEAMSCGTRVVTSNTSSLPEVGGDVAVYVDPRSEESILAALEALDRDDAALRMSQQRCIEQAARFSWEACARQTMEAYDKCLAG
jgi:glycosyltransferase involved in cell wall biosynthesis